MARRLQRILVTGATRGLGREFARQYLARGAQLFAGTRDRAGQESLRELRREYPERLTLLVLDVRRPEQLARGIARLSKRITALDLLINNAGISPRAERLGRLDPGVMLDTLRTNAVGPLMMAQLCRPLLRRGQRPKIVNISSQMGSLTVKSSGGHYSYCSSKAALNMLTRALAHDLRADGITVCALHPGWVRTDMGGPQALLDPEESVTGMRAVIARVGLRESGSFFDWQGQVHPW